MRHCTLQVVVSIRYYAVRGASTIRHHAETALWTIRHYADQGMEIMRFHAEPAVLFLSGLVEVCMTRYTLSGRQSNYVYTFTCGNGRYTALNERNYSMMI